MSIALVRAATARQSGQLPVILLLLLSNPHRELRLTICRRHRRLRRKRQKRKRKLSGNAMRMRRAMTRLKVSVGSQECSGHKSAGVTRVQVVLLTRTNLTVIN